MKRTWRLATVIGLLAAGCSGEDPVLPLEIFVSGSGVGGGFIDTPRAAPLVFEGACEDGERVVVGALGDIIFYADNQTQALGTGEEPGTGYGSHWRPVQDLMKAADLLYGNFEGTTSCCRDEDGNSVEDPGMRFDSAAYSSHPTYNYHASLANDLVEAGLDVLSTANNHAMDRGAWGADATLDALHAAGLATTGTIRADDPEPRWHAVVEAQGFRVAFLACTFSTNGIEDPEHQVLRCNKDRSEVVDLVAELSRDEEIDAVILAPHGGKQWAPRHSSSMRQLAADVFEAGALAVLANHPHTIQDWEMYRLPDGRQGFVIYSLANFVGSWSNAEKRAGLILYLGLTRRADGLVALNGVTFVPIAIQKADGVYFQEAIDRLDSGDPDARAVLAGRLSAWNIHPPAAPIVTNPQCDDGWVGATEFRGAIGDGCERSTHCEEGLVCDPTWRDGYCKLKCDTDEDCPRAPDRGPARCVQFEERSICLRTCASQAECRVDYECRELTAAQTEDPTRACVPAPPAEE